MNIKLHHFGLEINLYAFSNNKVDDLINSYYENKRQEFSNISDENEIKNRFKQLPKVFDNFIKNYKNEEFELFDNFIKNLRMKSLSYLII